ncbi:MAG: hypothetical protein CL666_09420 [Balneola sp.]|nr:hypothetical protein [Balneola sp.]
MKIPFITLLLSSLLLSIMPLQAQDFNLDDHKWKDRVLLVFSPNTYNPDFRDQAKQLKNARKGINERDLKVFYVLQESSASVKGDVLEGDETSDLLTEFDVSSGDFVVILVGKDGTKKLQTEESISSDRLFEVIDDMPMRKLEMKEDGKGN